MTDYGPGFWPFDEASGSVAHDTVGSHNGTFNDTSHITYRIPAPSLSPYGVAFNRYANGNPYYSNPYSAPSFSVATVANGWGSLNSRQAFTIAFKARFYGPVQHIGPFSGFVLGNILSNNKIVLSFLTNQGQDPYALSFSRRGGSFPLNSTVDFPQGVDYNFYDDWTGVYKEPIKTPQWAQIVLRYDGNRKSIWMDGVKTAEDSVDDTFSIGADGGAGTLRLNTVNQMDFSELALYHHALTDVEIGG